MSQVYTRGQLGGNHGSSRVGSARYRGGDSVVYHQSMFLKRLSQAKEENEKAHHATGWRKKLGHLLESRPEQIFIFSLIILDLLVICTQLFIIEPHQTKCHNHEVTMYSTPAPEPDPSSGETSEKWELAAEVLDDISLGILGILGLEIVLLLVAFDLDFFKQPLYILDAVVIAASLFIEIHFSGENANAGGLLIFFRLWRIVRIVHGVAMSVQEKNEEQIKMLEEEVGKLAKEKMELTTKFDYLKKRYKKLVATQEENQEESKITTPIPPLTSLTSLTSSTSSPLFESPQAPHMPQPHTRLNGAGAKKLRIDDADIKDDDDMYDSQTFGLPPADNVINVNSDVAGEGDIRQPLVRGSVSAHVGSEYSTFKHH